MEYSKSIPTVRLRRLAVCIALLWLLVGCQSAVSTSDLSVAVAQVVSGRDFEVAGVAAQPELTERVRLEGVDVPDVSQQPWGATAKSLLEKHLRGKTVRLETDAEPHDAIGRRLAYVWLGDRLLNELLVAEGYAVVAPHVPNSRYDQRLAHAQDRARILGLGIWNPTQPMRQSPAEFRRQQWGKGEAVR